MKILPDLICLAGITAVCYGLWQVHPSLSWLAGGAVVIAVGVTAHNKSKPKTAAPSA